MALKTPENQSQAQNNENSQKLVIQEKVSMFLERKFRRSRSFKTIETYKQAINKFTVFLASKYSLDFIQLLKAIESKQKDPLDIIDDYYTFLTKCPNKTGKTGLSRSTTANYLSVAKEFLNGEGCKIYQEDIRNRFRLPPISRTYEKGLSRQTINRVLRLSNPKLSCTILMACSGGFRIGEIVQLQISDIDFTTNPTTITIRAETTKTRQTRVTHISSEATTALKDYLAKSGLREYNDEDKYIILKHHDERIRSLKHNITGKEFDKKPVVHLRKLLEKWETELQILGSEERYARDVTVAIQSLETKLSKVVREIPDLNTKNDNGRNYFHFHALRAWFKTQVTDAHQSDFAEALMGHSSLKLLYYRQNDKARAETYRQIEHAVTIADTEKFDENFTEMQEDYQDLRRQFDGLSKFVRNLEKNVVLKTKS